MVEKKDSFNSLDDSISRSRSNSSISSPMNNVDDESAALLSSPPARMTAAATNNPTEFDLRDPSIQSVADSGVDPPPPPYERVVGVSSAGVSGDGGQSPTDDENVGDNSSARVSPQDEQQHDKVRCGAGVASGLFGLLMGGPVLALLLGLGTAYAADQPGAAGDVARAIGEVALIAQEKFRNLDAQHGFVDQGRDVATRTLAKLQEADRRHRFVDRIKEFSIRAFQTTSAFVKEHRLIERGMLAVGRAAYWVANKVAERVNANSPPPPPPASGGGVGARPGPNGYRAVSGSDKF